jgi:cellulose synthase/poly-beta-1,6-N-acetylglucosamine synthase-like glycosyltransferase
MVDQGFPRVAVMIPMLNEERFIENCINSVLDQNYPKENLEILVVDGGSRDRSLDIVRELVSKHHCVRLLGATGLNCPAALNCAIAATEADILCKVDAHGYVEQDFLRTAVACFQRDRRLMCIGGPIRPLARSVVGLSNSVARTSKFGVGHGVNTLGQEEEQLVETVQCGAYRKEIFDAVGGFDETLQFGEDEEMNWRIIQAGHHILYTPSMRFYYFPRETFRSFFMQYHRYGRARVRVVRKHPRFLKGKHVVPSGFIVVLIAMLAASPFSENAMLFLLSASAAYSGCSLIASVSSVPRTRPVLVLLLPVSFACLHFGYGLGFLRGIADWFSECLARYR